MKLYEIKREIQEIQDRMDWITSEDYPPEQKEKMLEEEFANMKLLGISFDEKAENIVAILQGKKAEEEAIGNEIKRLSARKSSVHNGYDMLKMYLETEMKSLGKDKIKGTLFSIWIQNNPPCVKYAENFDVTTLPDELKKVEISPRSSEIMKYYKETGEILPGTSIEQGRSLRYR